MTKQPMIMTFPRTLTAVDPAQLKWRSVSTWRHICRHWLLAAMPMTFAMTPAGALTLKQVSRNAIMSSNLACTTNVKKKLMKQSGTFKKALNLFARAMPIHFTSWWRLEGRPPTKMLRKSTVLVNEWFNNQNNHAILRIKDYLSYSQTNTEHYLSSNGRWKNIA